MGRIPITYKAYDNGFRIPMGICLSVGGTFLIGGIMSEEVAVFVIGIIALVLFVVFKILNSVYAKKEVEANMEYCKEEVEKVLKNDQLTDHEKITKIIDLSQNGNVYATLFLQELKKGIE